MKKLKLKDRWILTAGVLGGIAIGTSLIALVRVLRNRSASEDETDDKGHKARGEEGEQPVRHRRHGRHGDRRAKAGVGEGSDTADISQSAGSAQRH